MNFKFIGITVLSAIFLTSCRQSENVKKETVRPVKLIEAQALNVVEKSYSATVSPDQFSDLAFRVSGPIVAMNVLEGQKVKKGDIVAEIDPTDVQLELDARKASYINALSKKERAEKLLSKNAISIQEYEMTQASYTSAKSAFEYAENNLRDTKLRAPFDGFIQKKYVENYQRVQAGQAVVCLINPARLQVQFTIPETNISYFSDPHTIFVEFDTYKGKMFKAEVKEYVEASPDGSGVPVFLKITDPDFDLNKYKISVGFSCRVIVRVENESVKEGIKIPLSAIYYDNNLKEKTVFVYNSQNQNVEQRIITDKGAIVDRDEVVVTGNISAGDMIVSAGVTKLVDGQKVKVLNK